MRILPIVALLGLATVAQANKNLSSPDRVLAGRPAGTPVQCIDQSRIIDTQTFDDGSIYYRMLGSADYVNRPHDCPELTSNHSYSSSSPSTQLCAGDSLRVFDAAARIPYGACIFNTFTPYPKPAKHAR